MKKMLLLLVVVLVALPLSARPRLEFSPKGSLYIDGGVSFGVGADLTVNPKKNIGVRVNLAEFVFGDFEGITINSSLSPTNPTTFDVLYYTNIANLFSYIAFTFGYSNVYFDDALSFGGGIGIEKYMGKGNYLFLEPGLTYIDIGAGDGELIFRVPFGLKLGL